MLYTILVVILILILLGGIGPWSPRGPGYGWGAPPLVVVIVIILIIVLLGGHRW